MPKSVQLSAYGGADRLRIVGVAKPEPNAGEAVVRVVAAGTNPGEISIREGLLEDMYPREFPFGQGSDFAGRIESVGAGVSGFSPGDEVLGWTDQRSAQAEYVAVSPSQLIPKPPALDWFRAGSLFVVATTAVAACARYRYSQARSSQSAALRAAWDRSRSSSRDVRVPS